MKKKLILTLLLCACLTSCVGPITSPIDTESSTSNEEPSNPNQTEDANTKIAYYEGLVNELQQELLNVKAELYVSRVEYESRIAELEKKVENKPPIQGEENESKVEVSNFTYENKNGALTITAYNGNKKSVSIPSSINGYAVTAIGDRAFSNHSELISVTIPESVTSIGWFSFSGCVALSEVSIPSSVETIGYGAFQNCNGNLTIKCPLSSYAHLYANSYGINTTR